MGAPAGQGCGILQLLPSSSWVPVVHVDKAHWTRGQRFLLKPRSPLGRVPAPCVDVHGTLSHLPSREQRPKGACVQGSRAEMLENTMPCSRSAVSQAVSPPAVTQYGSRQEEGRDLVLPRQPPRSSAASPSLRVGLNWLRAPISTPDKNPPTMSGNSHFSSGTGQDLSVRTHVHGTLTERRRLRGARGRRRGGRPAPPHAAGTAPVCRLRENSMLCGRKISLGQL